MVAAAVLSVLLCAINLLVCSLRVALVRERAAFAQPPPIPQAAKGRLQPAARGLCATKFACCRVLCGTVRN